MPTILDVNFGCEFFGWPEALEKQGRKIRHQNSPAISQNSPDQNKKFTPNPLCITSGPTFEAKSRLEAKKSHARNSTSSPSSHLNSC